MATFSLLLHNADVSEAVVPLLPGAADVSVCFALADSLINGNSMGIAKVCCSTCVVVTEGTGRRIGGLRLAMSGWLGNQGLRDSYDC